MVCPTCLCSDKFRLSRFRSSDYPSLLTLRYPVRCRRCSHRARVSLMYAFHLWQGRKQRRQRRLMENRGTAH